MNVIHFELSQNNFLLTFLSKSHQQINVLHNVCTFSPNVQHAKVEEEHGVFQCTHDMQSEWCPPVNTLKKTQVSVHTKKT